MFDYALSAALAAKSRPRPARDVERLAGSSVTLAVRAARHFLMRFLTQRSSPCKCCAVVVAAVPLLTIACLMPAIADSQSTSATTHQGAVVPPYWAFPVDPPVRKPAASAAALACSALRVPGSAASFTAAEIADLFNAPDWHPADHPRMPQVVAHGRPPDIFACAYCHLPNGQGRPENASLAGLPANYIVQQVNEFKSGRRGSSEPRFLPTSYMMQVAAKVSASDVEAAAAYFSRLKLRPWVRVVETSLVPKTRVAGWMLIPAIPGGTEPISERIIETPVHPERTELRDDRSGFVAYVPPGSVEAGASLVDTGSAGKTIPCTTCHGRDLRGLGGVPHLAGRDPTYIVRQLYEIQHGIRTGPAVALMQAPVANLTETDMVAIAAYIASLPP